MATATLFRATNDDIEKLLATATNASRPAGMGYIHYPSGYYTPEQFRGMASADYFDGRMVKLYPRVVRTDEDDVKVWSLTDPQYDANDLERTYQSWGATYPTAKALIEAAGLQIVAETE